MSTNSCAIAKESGISHYVEMYRRGVWRARVLHDMIAESIASRGTSSALTVLDIGCGKAFDDDAPLQRSLASSAARSIGVEPDLGIVPQQDCFHELHRCPFEEAPIATGSVDVAFAIMVLEHLRKPQIFWNKLHDVLAPGGVFWAATVDARHWFCKVSRCAGWLRLKEPYLRLIGEHGDGHYKNYPVHYRSNTPYQIRQYTSRFRTCELTNFSRAGELEKYFPHWLRPAAGYMGRRAVASGGLGTLLVIRAVK